MYDYDRRIRENYHNPPHPDKPWVLNLDSHAVIFGKTGTGKSNYLKHVFNELEKDDGNIVIIDPHGDVADYAICRTNRNAVFLSGHDYEGAEGRYAGLNLIEASGSFEEAQLIGDWVKQAFSKEESLSKGTWGPRLDLVFSSVLVEMMRRKKGLTLREFTSLLPNGKNLLSYFPRQENSASGNFIRLQNISTKQWTEFVTSSMHKLLPIVENPFVRRVVSRKNEDSVDMDSAILSFNSLIVPELNLGRLAESPVRIISTMVLAKIWNVLLRNGPTNRKTHIVIDEAHLISEPILEMFLAQGRKYGINVILGYQSAAQLSDSFIEMLFSNIQGYAAFSLSREGAEIISRNTPKTRDINALRRTLIDQERYKVTVSCEIYDEAKGRFARYGPVTHTPDQITGEPDRDEVQRVKAALLKEKGTEDREQDTEAESGWTGHNRMIFMFSEFLEARGIQNMVEPDIGGIVPDLLIRHGEKEIICEVEDSDILVTHRVAKKMVDYSGKNLIFLCRGEDLQDLFSLISNIIEAAEKGVDYSYEGESVSASKAITALPKISFVAIQDNEFYFYNGTGLVKFLTTHLERSSSIVYRAKKLPMGTLRSEALGDYIGMVAQECGVNIDRIEEKYGRDRLRSLYQSMIERGYEEPASLISLLELDRAGAETEDETVD